MAKDKKYKRLPGRMFSVYDEQSVWEADDHILLVRDRGYTEFYKRFYYRDIRAFLIKKSSEYAGWMLLFLGFAALFLVIGILSWLLNGFAETLPVVIIFVICCLAALINHLRGPSCIFYINTPVQTERIACLKRRAQVRKFLARVRPHLEAAQGAIDEANWETAREGLYPRTLAVEATAPRFASPSESRPIPTALMKPEIRRFTEKHYRYFMISFGCLVFIGLFGFFITFNHNLLLAGLGSMLLTLAFGLIIGNLVAYRLGGAPPEMKAPVWASFSLVIFSVAISYVYIFIVSLDGGYETQFDLYREILALDPKDSLGLLILDLVYSLLTVGVGLFGLDRSRTVWRSRPDGGASQPASASLPESEGLET